MASLILFILTTAVHLALRAHMATPIVHADEYGYLMGARFLARGGLPTGTPYSPGYSLVMAPLWWFSDNGRTVYRDALYVNCLLAGLTTVLLFRLATRLAPDIRVLSRAGAAVAVSAFPPLLLSSDLALSENLLVPALLLLWLAAWRALEDPTPRAWAGVGLLSGLVLLIHERALVVAPLVVALAAIQLRPWSRHRRALWSLSGTAAAVLGASIWLTHQVTRSPAVYRWPARANTAGGLIGRLTTITGWRHALVELAGQGLYLLAAAGPLVVAGIAHLLSEARGARGAGRTGSGRAAALLLLGAPLLAAGLAAVFLGTGSRVDNAIYGRYVEAFVPGMLLAGALAGPRWARSAEPSPGVEAGTSRWVSVIALSGGAVGLVGLAVVCASYWGTLRGPAVLSNVFGVAEVVRHSQATLSWVVLAGAGLVLLVVVGVAFRAKGPVGLAAFVALSLPASASGYSYLVTQSAGRLSQDSLPAAVTAIQRSHPGLDCVSWDAAVNDAWTFYNTRLLAPTAVFPLFDSARGGRLPCTSTLVVAGHGFGSQADYRGARALLSLSSPESLWVLPGPLADQLRQQRFGSG